MCVLAVFAAFADKYLRKRYISIYIVMFFMLYGFLTTANVSTLYDSTGMQEKLVGILCIYLAYKYNFKKKIL